MAAGLTFADVRKIGLALEGVEEGTAYGAFCLKVNKKMIACQAINKQAEPNSLMIRMPIDQRDALRDLLTGAWREASARKARRRQS